MRSSVLLFGCLWLALIPSYFSWGQSAQAVFGRNRIQYTTPVWNYLISNHFDVYYHPGSDAFARRAIAAGEQEYVRISELIGYAPYNRIRLYLYDAPLKQTQSNIGLETSASLLGGKTNFIKSIVEISYSKSQAQLRTDLARGLAKAVVYDMMYGGSFTEAVQKSYLMTLPDWFVDGAVAFAAEGSTLALDNWARDEAASGRMRRLNAKKGLEAERLGQSFWAFVAERYGRTNVSNILNLTRIIRNEENAISATLGVPYSVLVRDWRSYYNTLAEQTKTELTAFPDESLQKLRTRRDDEIFGIAVSPTGKYLAWASQTEGRTRLGLKDLETGRQHIMWRHGERHPDFNNIVPSSPVSFIGPDQVATVYHKRDKLELLIFNMHGKLKARYPLEDIDQVDYLAFSADGKKGVVVGAVRGQTDIFQINPETGKIRQLTNDLADEADPVLDAKDQFVYFASSQTPAEDTLGKNQIERRYALRSKIFRLALVAKAQPERVAVGIANLTSPMLHPKLGLLAVSDACGVMNIVRADSAHAGEPISAFSNSLERAALTPSGNRLVGLVRSEGKTGLLVLDSLKPLEMKEMPLSPWREAHPILPPSEVAKYQDHEPKLAVNPTVLNPKDTQPAPPPVVQGALVVPNQTVLNQPKITAPAHQLLADSLAALDPIIDIHHYVFEDEVPTPNTSPLNGLATPNVSVQALPSLGAAPGVGIRLNPGSALPTGGYKGGLPTLQELKSGRKLIQRDVFQPKVTVSGPFAATNMLTSNSVTTNIGVDPYRGLGLLMQANISDYFENHRFQLSLQPYFDLRTSNYAVDYQFLKHRLDFSAHFARNSLYIVDNSYVQKNFQYVYQVGVSYPISRAMRVSAYPYIQQTNFYDLFDNTRTGEKSRAYAGARFEAVYDNGYTNTSNITTGTKMRLVVDNNTGVGDAKRGFGSIFIDLRRYQRVHNEITLALRLSGGRFFGPAKKQYMLGGMDNWIFNRTATHSTNATDDPQVNRELATEGHASWFYNPFVTNLRGFDYNTQYGNNFLLMNAELRIPLVKYLYKGPIASNFLRNFQIVAFYDAGSAWSGQSLFNRENSINTNVTKNGPFTITTINSRSPFLIGYGAGVRTMVLGYSAKLDFALGRQDYTSLNKRIYLTLGYDF